MIQTGWAVFWALACFNLGWFVSRLAGRVRQELDMKKQQKP